MGLGPAVNTRGVKANTGYWRHLPENQPLCIQENLRQNPNRIYFCCRYLSGGRRSALEKISYYPAAAREALLSYSNCQVVTAPPQTDWIPSTFSKRKRHTTFSISKRARTQQFYRSKDNYTHRYTSAMEPSAAGHSLNNTPAGRGDGELDTAAMHRYARQRSVESRYGGNSVLLGGDVLQVDMGQLANVLGEMGIFCLCSTVLCDAASIAGLAN